MVLHLPCSDVPFEMRVDEVLKWLSPANPEDIPDFLSLYFEEPDWAGHEDGPYGDEVSIIWDEAIVVSELVECDCLLSLYFILMLGWGGVGFTSPKFTLYFILMLQGSQSPLKKTFVYMWDTE